MILMSGLQLTVNKRLGTHSISLLFYPFNLSLIKEHLHAFSWGRFRNSKQSKGQSGI